MSELELLARAHALFLGESAPVAVGAPDAEKAVAALGAGADRVAVTAGYRRTITDARTDFWRAGVTDGTAHTRLADARAEHAEARTVTGRILAEARADQVPTSNSPVAQREALRRRIRRLRAQHRQPPGPGRAVGCVCLHQFDGHALVREQPNQLPALVRHASGRRGQRPDDDNPGEGRCALPDRLRIALRPPRPKAPGEPQGDDDEDKPDEPKPDGPIDTV